MGEGYIDRFRDIVLFVAGIVGIAGLILAAFEGFSQRIASAVFLGTLGVVCIFLVFIPKLEVFKVWGVEARLIKTLDRAEEILGKLQRLSAISARATYMQMAWGNRMGAPTAREKQEILDEVDAQLKELDAKPHEVAVIKKPFVRMIALDFYLMFKGTIGEYASLRYSALIDRANRLQTPEANQARADHSEKITTWNRKTNEPRPLERLKNSTLEAELTAYLPAEGGWLTKRELEAAEDLKQKILKLNAESEAKGGYTQAAASFYDKYSRETKELAEEFFKEPLEELRSKP